MTNDIILAGLGILVVISQTTLLGFKLQERLTQKKERNGSKTNPTTVPGLASVCVNHGVAIARVETKLNSIDKRRKEDREDDKAFKTGLTTQLDNIWNKVNQPK